MTNTQPGEAHSHMCGECEHIWTHVRPEGDIERSAYVESHTCPNCRKGPFFLSFEPGSMTDEVKPEFLERQKDSDSSMKKINLGDPDLIDKLLDVLLLLALLERKGKNNERLELHRREGDSEPAAPEAPADR